MFETKNVHFDDAAAPNVVETRLEVREIIVCEVAVGELPERKSNKGETGIVS